MSESYNFAADAELSELLTTAMNEAIVEESLKAKYPDISDEDVAELQQRCKNPWDAVILYEMVLMLRDK